MDRCVQGPLGSPIAEVTPAATVAARSCRQGHRDRDPDVDLARSRERETVCLIDAKPREGDLKAVGTSARVRAGPRFSWR